MSIFVDGKCIDIIPNMKVGDIIDDGQILMYGRKEYHDKDELLSDIGIGLQAHLSIITKTTKNVIIYIIYWEDRSRYKDEYNIQLYENTKYYTTDILNLIPKKYTNTSNIVWDYYFDCPKHFKKIEDDPFDDCIHCGHDYDIDVFIDPKMYTILSNMSYAERFIIGRCGCKYQGTFRSSNDSDEYIIIDSPIKNELVIKILDTRV